MKTRSRNRQSGAVLIIVMMVMLGLLGLGVTALWLTSGNLQVGANINQRAQALYLAEAGIDQARMLLNPPAPGITDAQMTVLLTGANRPLDNRPTGVDATGAPNGIGVIFMNGAVPLENIVYPPLTFGRTAGTADAPLAATMGTYTVWIRNDTAEIRNPAAGCPGCANDDNNAVVVRSRGVANDGRTNVVLEVSLGGNPGGPGNPTAVPPPPPVLCNAGKNACDDNNSTISGVVAN